MVDFQCGELSCGAKINKITPQGSRIVLASFELSFRPGSSQRRQRLCGGLQRGIIYEYKPDGRERPSLGLHDPAGLFLTARATWLWRITASVTSIKAASTNKNQRVAQPSPR